MTLKSDLVRVRALGTQVLWHGTRFMSAILRDDELGAPIVGESSVFFSTSPDIAGFWACFCRPFDEGRAGLIALDRSKLAAKFSITPVQHFPEPFYRGEAIDAPLEGLSEFIVATLWLDELRPGWGMATSPTPEGEQPYMPAISLASVARELRDLRRLGADMPPRNLKNATRTPSNGSTFGLTFHSPRNVGPVHHRPGSRRASVRRDPLAGLPRAAARRLGG